MAVPTLPLRMPALRWPLPALLAWAAGWAATLLLLRSQAVPAALAIAAGLAAGAAPAVFAATFWRRVIVAGGFPLSLVASGAAGALPAWAWLVPLAMLGLAYPVGAWRDAPVFPTPRGALAGVGAHVALVPGGSVLDAGCGLGHGLRALRAAWPEARICGVERSWPLALAAGLACPWARVARGDMWRGSWSGHALVYLFQRPESMARALAKADAEMAAGSWLVSLEFEAPGRRPHAVVRLANGRPVWIYGVGREAADKDSLRETAVPERIEARSAGISRRTSAQARRGTGR